nr:acyltransferase [Emticicia fluvialis]
MIQFIKKFRNLILAKIIWRNYNIGSNFHAGIRVRLWAKNYIRIGDNFYIGRDSQIECDAEIGNNVIFGNRVALVGKYDHHYQQTGVPTRLAAQIRDGNYNWKGIESKVVIEDDVWVGYGVIIMSGVKIGMGSIIAAGAIVTKDVAPFSIYAGVPAKRISDRFDSIEELNLHKKILGIDIL